MQQLKKHKNFRIFLYSGHFGKFRILLVMLLSLYYSNSYAYNVNEILCQLYEPTGQPIDTLFYNRYPYVILIDDDVENAIDDDYFFNNAASVVFQVSKTDLPKGDNVLQDLGESVLPHINKDSLRVVTVKLRGAASPEGPVEFNDHLAKGRMRALRDYIASRLQLSPNTTLVFETEVEDYHYLYRQMEQNGDPAYDVVKRLFDKYMPEQRYTELKRELQAIDGGKLWSRLLVTYYPSLRAARMVIVCQKPVEKKEEPVVVQPPVITQPPVEPEPEPWFEMVPRRELLSVKTNLLFYGVYMPGYDKWCPIPNIAVEYYPKRGHFTYGASFDCPWWQHYRHHKYFQIRNYQLETRYYLKRGDIELHPEGKGAAFKGWYFQGYVHGGLFGICFDANRGWEGEGAGAGIGAGYVIPLSKKQHWRLELQAQFGVFFCKYDPYQYENPIEPRYHDDLYYYKWKGRASLFKRRQYNYTWVGPTRIGVTLSYDLLYRKARKETPGYRHRKATHIYKHYNPFRPYETRLNNGKGGEL